MKYDLEERTAKFAESVIAFTKCLTLSPINSRLISQVVGSSGSIAANYCEAVEGESKKDFVHKIGIAKKEIKETKLWLRLLAKAHPEKSEELKGIWKEAQELLLIFSKIVSTSRGN
jgi:four helix bundle protein